MLKQQVSSCICVPRDGEVSHSAQSGVPAELRCGTDLAEPSRRGLWANPAAPSSSAPRDFPGQAHPEFQPCKLGLGAVR